MSSLGEHDRELAGAQQSSNHAQIAKAIQNIVSCVKNVEPSQIMSTLENETPTFYGTYPFLCDKLAVGLTPKDEEMLAFMLNRMKRSPSVTTDKETQLVMERVSEM